jgi:hypothetical protein
MMAFAHLNRTTTGRTVQLCVRINVLHCRFSDVAHKIVQPKAIFGTSSFMTMKVTSLALLLCAAAGGISAVEILVNHFEDGTGTDFGCSTDADQCNLRSAWLQCHENLNEPCTVKLPVNSYHTFNVTIGQLELK